MWYKIYTVLIVLLVIATVTGAVCGLSWTWIAGGCAAILIVLAFQYRSVSKPLRAVESGMYLLRDQDFSSRLRLTGQPDADRVVNLYNSLIESMKAERLKTQEQNRFLSLVVDASPLGIAICDFDGNITETNRAWNAMQSPAMTKAIESVADGESQTVRLADALIVRISKLWFMDSGFKRRFILVERLTDEIAAAEKQMFNKIVRTIGHEVNNTLGSVISVLDSLGEMHQDDPFAADAITSSTRSCTNLVNFVRGYADIVKLPPVTPEPVRLNEWTAGILPTLKALTPENITVTLTPDASGIGDRPDGLIQIQTESNGIKVTDNGRGISDEAAEKLFTPFFSTKRPDRGLGLMLIADILRAHRARFSLATAPDTRLTTFSIALSKRV